MAEPNIGHQTTDANALGILWFGIGLAVTLMLVAAATGLFLHWLEDAHHSRANDSRTQQQIVVPPPPRLQAEPSRELAELHARDEKLLHSYDWVDRKAGVIRIPIERAMELTAERGLPARTSNPEKAQ